MITLIVNINVIPEHFYDFVDACRNARKQVFLNEPQCHAYTVNQDPNNENGVILVEVYENEYALEYHKKTPHFIEWAEIRDKLSASRNTIRLESL